MAGLFEMVNLYTSLVGILSSLAQLNFQQFFLVKPFTSVFVSKDISVGKLSPDFIFSIELVNLSTSKSRTVSFRFFTLRIYKKVVYHFFHDYFERK